MSGNHRSYRRATVPVTENMDDCKQCYGCRLSCQESLEEQVLSCHVQPPYFPPNLQDYQCLWIYLYSLSISFIFYSAKYAFAHLQYDYADISLWSFTYLLTNLIFCQSYICIYIKVCKWKSIYDHSLHLLNSWVCKIKKYKCITLRCIFLVI